MDLKKKFKVEKITDTVVEKAEEEEAQKIRTVVLNAEEVTVTLKGDPGELTGFVTGDSVEVQVKQLQAKLFEKVEEEGSEGR